MSSLFKVLAGVALASAMAMSSAAADSCAGTLTKSYQGVWPWGGWVYTFSGCVGTCDTGSCAVQTSGTGAYQYCGCPGGGELACCHVVLLGYLDEGGAFVPTGYGKRGDCPSCGALYSCLLDVPFLGGEISAVCSDI